MEPHFFNEHVRNPDVMVALIAIADVALVILWFEFASQLVQGVLWGIGCGIIVAAFCYTKFPACGSWLAVRLFWCTRIRLL